MGRAFAAGVRDGSITMPGSSRLVFQCLGEILWSTHTLPRVSVERLTRYNLETVLWAPRRSNGQIGSRTGRSV
ncbi:hypothetical protein GS462_26095 [Rhodococcus hoagii]|nr:hypothetical protein [Prescottella equi]